MSEKKEQVKPLAPAVHRGLDIEESDHAFAVEYTTRRRRRCIKCCGCSAAILLIIVMVSLVLTFTVFRVSEPILKMNSMTINGTLDSLMNSSTRNNSLQGVNLTVEADVSVKNPNAGSFKFSNATTILYYDGLIIGEDKNGPNREVRARRTLRMNVTIAIMVEKMSKAARFESDLSAGLLGISSYTRISGKIKITSAVKRNFVVKMNCTMNVNIRSKRIQDQNCRRRVSL